MPICPGKWRWAAKSNAFAADCRRHMNVNQYMTQPRIHLASSGGCVSVQDTTALRPEHCSVASHGTIGRREVHRRLFDGIDRLDACSGHGGLAKYFGSRRLGPTAFAYVCHSYPGGHGAVAPRLQGADSRWLIAASSVHTSARDYPRFPSTQSQNRAAISAPPKRRTSRTPVGEVTLISVM